MYLKKKLASLGDLLSWGTDDSLLNTG